MASRTIENPRDRLVTILVAPLTTCSARLPVYTLLVAAFIPNREFFMGLRLQGVVLLGLYAAGLVSALLVAMLLRSTILRGPKPPLLMELPTYKLPSPRDIALGLWQRAMVFVKNAGTIILLLTIVLWFLAYYPRPPEGWKPALGETPITYSFAGKIGKALEPVVLPIGFNWKIAVALVPGFAAREVMISALSTVYALEEHEDSTTHQALSEKIRSDWSLATGLSLIVWYILACQCISTLAITRRETNSWRWPLFMLSYMTTLAYGACWLVYHCATKMGWG